MLKLLISDNSGNIYEQSQYLSVARSGEFLFVPNVSDFIKLPEESKLFFIPDSVPLGYHKEKFNITQVNEGLCVSAFLPPGYLRLYLPAYERVKKRYLPFYGYSHIASYNNDFMVAAIKVDDDSAWNPANYDFTSNFLSVVKPLLEKFPNNRIINQLAKCALEYNCTAAKNFFMGQYEAPIPTAATCNSSCLGCISHNKKGLITPQKRLNYTVGFDEIVEVALIHNDRAEDPIISFGQGCEGDPIMEADTIIKAIKIIKKKCPGLTINFNSNCSVPENVEKLIDAGLDSIRLTIFSFNETLYNQYHKPINYNFDDVLKSLRLISSSNIFSSINLLVFPGVTDRQKEAKLLQNALVDYRINMIQWRNLNIDPFLLLENIQLEPDEVLGLKNLLKLIKKTQKNLFYGYFNRPKKLFKKDIFPFKIK
jgi:pyruvate-formate lyase-activating enzyme